MESLRFFIDLALVDSPSNIKPGMSPGVKGGRCPSRPVYLLLHVTWDLLLLVSRPSRSPPKDVIPSDLVSRAAYLYRLISVDSIFKVLRGH